MKRHVKWALVLPDIHHPFHNKACIKAIKQWLTEYGRKINYFVLLGDQMDFMSISYWLRDKKRSLEGKRLAKDYRDFDKDILTPFEQLLGKKCQKIFFIGNHEHRVEQAIDENPQGEGYWEINRNLKLIERDWKIIKFNQVYWLGKLCLMHGIYTNQYHARKTVDVFCRSIAYGHTHDCQEYTKVIPMDSGTVHKARSIGCLCDRNPDYLKNKPNKWVHAFMVVDISPNGDFTEHTINIINGKFRWHGKLYGS